MEQIQTSRKWFIEDMMIPRRAQAHTAIIVEIPNFDTLIKSEIHKLSLPISGDNLTFDDLFTPPIHYAHSYIYDLQRGTIRDFKTKNSEGQLGKMVEGEGWDNPLKQLDAEMRILEKPREWEETKKPKPVPCTVTIENVYNQQQVEFLQDFLVATAQDGTVFNSGSASITITDNINLFPQTIRKICHCFTVPPASEEERWKIGRDLTSNLKTGLPKRAKELMDEGKIDEEGFKQRVRAAAALEMTQELVAKSNGFYPQEWQASLMRGISREYAYNIQDIKTVKEQKMKAQGLLYSEPNMPRSHIGGYEEFLNNFDDLIGRPLREPELAAAYGVDPIHGVVLAGPPGVGKTVLTKCIATTSGLPFATVNSADVMSKWQGESQQNIRNLFRTANENAPMILFFDEAEAMFPSRDRGAVGIGDGGTKQETLNIALEALGDQKNKVITILASNHIELMDSAVYRAGRTDRVLFVGLPDPTARAKVWTVHTTVVPMAKFGRPIPLADDIDVNVIVDKTFAWNCGEIEQLAKESGRLAFKERTPKVTMPQVLRVIDGMKINEAIRIAKVRQSIQSVKEIENYDRTSVQIAEQSLHRAAGDAEGNQLSALLGQAV